MVNLLKERLALGVLMELIDKYLALQNSLLNARYRDGILDQDIDTKVKFILKKCAQQLNVERVSVWLFNDKKDALECLFIFNGKDNTFESGYTIAQKDHPNYFAALNQSRVLNITQAKQDERTIEFLDNYLSVLNIESMLDIPLFRHAVLDGVLCIEHTHTVREWDMAEISYAVSVADVVTLSRTYNEWHIENQKLKFLERVDALTNLENRCFFEKRIEQDLCSATEEKDCCLMLVGLDNFTRVNDEHGYDFANKVLCKVSKRLSKLDFPFEYSLARLGGDTFAIWFFAPSGFGKVSELAELAQRSVRKRISSPLNEKVSVTASVGVFVDNVHTLTNRNLIRQAEIAMAKAKSSGIEQYSLYLPEWASDYEEEVQLEKEFLSALENEQIVSHFQPIMGKNYQDEGISLEALVRWLHPVKGVITPYIILPLAQRLGAMEALGNRVLEHTCQSILQFIQQGVKLKKVSVNITSEQLASQHFIAFVTKTVEKYQVPYELLEFEIVEEAISSDSKALAKQIMAITALGIQLSIDDFGTGYSSLSRLKNLKVSKLKIDKSFVDGLPDDEGDVCIAKSIIGLAKGLNLKLVAEGVETQAQANWLIENGCDYLQGYLFSKPVGSESIPDFTRQQHDIACVKSNQFTIKPQANIIEIIASGVWYLDTFEHFIAELDKAKDKVCSNPWALIVHTNRLNFGSVDFQKTIRDFINGLKKQNLRATAYVVDDQDLVTQQLELINRSDDSYKRAFFRTEQEAYNWLKQLGF